MPQKNKPLVSIIMGSQSDYSTMRYAEKVLKGLKIRFEIKINKYDDSEVIDTDSVPLDD